MKQSRCPVCGAFYEGEKCPQNHPDFRPAPEVGRLVSYDGGVYIVISEPDEDGHVGVFSLRAHRTIPYNDARTLGAP